MDLEEFTSDPLKFASIMAHQLRSPLGSAAQAIQAVLGEYAGPVSPTQRGPLERAAARCDQAMTAVHRMLAILKAEQAGGPEQSAGATALSGVMRHAYVHYAQEAARRDIELVLETEIGEGDYVGISEPALAEVLSALLENALKYTPRHGRVRLRVARESPETVRVVVGDSGPGIPESERERVFEPFHRTTQAAESGQPGIGLGLAFVRSIVSAADGDIRVGESELGGAEFVVSLASVAKPTENGTTGREKPAFRVVIIGGVAAGPKAASKIIRLCPDADVTVIDKGDVLSYAGCGLPYYVSGVVRNQRALISSPAGVVRDPVFFRNVKNVHVMNRTEAVDLDLGRKRVLIRPVDGGVERWIEYDKLILATGAGPVIPPTLDASLGNVFTLHGVRDAEGIRAALAARQARNVVIIGGGLIGVEMTEALVEKGSRVTIIEQLPHILPMLDPELALLVERHMASRGVRIITNTPARSLEGTDTVTGVAIDSGVVPADLVILAIGVAPNAALAVDAGLKVGESGAILTDDHMVTSDPDVYAAGDCVETRHLLSGRACYFPLGSTANKQARVAAVNVCGGDDVFPGILRSCICKVFDYGMARTGCSEEHARSAGHDTLSVLVPGPDREHFVPGMGMVLMKLVVDAESRQLLGLQATGPGVVDKRVDVAAMAIAAGMTVDQLAQADLCYGPPYSAAMDILITAANVARNVLDGHMTGIKPTAVYRMLQDKEEMVLLDVRTLEEYERVHIAHSQHVPLSVLRGRMDSLPRDCPIITFCDLSLRGYEAALMLQAAGFSDVRVMEGGLAMWPFETVE